MAPLMVLPFRAQVYVYPLPVLPLSTTLPPEQKEVAPPAVIVFEGSATDDAGPLFDVMASLFVMGGGGWGGERLVWVVSCDRQWDCGRGRVW